jgi:hypothetical protein
MDINNPPKFLACVVAGKPELATLEDLAEVVASRASVSILDARAAFQMEDGARLETIGRDVAAEMMVRAIINLNSQLAAALYRISELELVSAKSVSRVEAVPEIPVAEATE